MMDLVYILGAGSTWNDNEIRFSLRSVEKNLVYGNVFIIGRKPEWMQNVIHIPAEDKFKNKVQNGGAKYYIASTHPDISENFILMNDDFFILKPISKIPFYSRGTAREAIKSHKSKQGYYFDTIRDTKFRLEKDGFTAEVMDFEVHAPIIFNKFRLKAVIERIKDKGVYLFRTYYGNVTGVTPKIVADFKAANVKEFHEEIAKNREFISISDSMVKSDDFRKWVQEKFPTVSKYENDGGEGIKAAPGVTLEYRSYHAAQAFDYRGKQFRRGELIDMNTIKALKKIPNMKHVWILK